MLFPIEQTRAELGVLSAAFKREPLFDAIHGFLYSDRSPTCKRMTYLEGGAFVNNADLVRQLCGEIANEKDREKAQDLLSLLQSVIKDNQEDIRIRMAFLAKKYGLVSDSKAAA
jgi:hypothetical protein